MQPEVFVVKHTADVRIIEYTLLGSLNRIAFFLNNFFEDIDLCCRSIFLVINEQKNNLSIHFMCNKIVSDDPGTTRFSFTFRLYCHSYFALSHKLYLFLGRFNPQICKPMKSVCGLDVHKDSVYLCILSEFGELIEKVFGVLTYQLEEMRDLMLHHHVVEV